MTILRHTRDERRY